MNSELFSIAVLPFLHSHQQCMKVAMFPCPYQYLLLPVIIVTIFLIIAILVNIGFDLHFLNN